MTVPQLDPSYVASQLRLLRKMWRLTQENVADMAGLTTRTIEKIESGRHTPNEQTIRSLCRGLGIEATIFFKPSPEEEARSKADMTRALKKIAIVATTAIKSPNDFMLVGNGCDAFRYETSTVESDEAQDIAAALVDYVTDLMDIWSEINSSDKLHYARDVVDRCMALGKLGYTCQIGFHRERLPSTNPITFRVGLLSVLKTSPNDDTRFAIVNLHGNWEVPEEDRPAFPTGAEAL